MREFHGITAPNRNDAFAVTAARGMISAMEALLADGADVDGILSKFGGALHGGSALHVAASCGMIGSVEFLITAGANLNLQDDMDLTPLMSACNTGNVKGSRIALRLVEARANVRYVRKTDEMTALKFAVKRCSPEVIQAWIDHGADVDGPRGTALTALMLAARANNVDALRVLVKNGARLSLKCKLPWAERTNRRGPRRIGEKKQGISVSAWFPQPLTIAGCKTPNHGVCSGPPPHSVLPRYTDQRGGR